MSLPFNLRCSRELEQYVRCLNKLQVGDVIQIYDPQVGLIYPSVVAVDSDINMFSLRDNKKLHYVKSILLGYPSQTEVFLDATILKKSIISNLHHLWTNFPKDWAAAFVNHRFFVRQIIKRPKVL